MMSLAKVANKPGTKINHPDVKILQSSRHFFTSDWTK